MYADSDPPNLYVPFANPVLPADEPTDAYVIVSALPGLTSSFLLKPDAQISIMFAMKDAPPPPTAAAFACVETAAVVAIANAATTEILRRNVI